MVDAYLNEEVPTEALDASAYKLEVAEIVLLAVVVKYGTLFAMVFAAVTLTLPEPPPPLQVEVVTAPVADTERQPPCPAREVMERFVVVAWPAIVVEARETRPPDWVRAEAKVAVPVVFRVPPILKAFDWVTVVPFALRVEVAKLFEPVQIAR